MSVEANKAAILKMWECVSAGDRAGQAALYDDDVVYHGGAGEEITGRDSVMAMLSGYFTAMPDVQAHVEDVFGEGDASSLVFG